ncbi:GNAT family N-acetyltransferase [Azospirillum sp.]|uniref:GNAT family N-acetyltransferase n=1 Tax=Azospirillum sp. TaxID=34012 RepID=UPI003D74BC1F
MPIAIETFSPDQTAGIAALIVPIQREEFGIPITYDDQPDLKDIQGFYRRGAGEFWVARDGSTVIGSIALLDIGEAGGALRKMFVHRDWRGAAHGVAQCLLDALLAHARRKGLAAIHLGTTDKFLAAHRFYEKNGFVAVPAEALPPTFPRMAVDTRFYRLGLG